MKKVIVISAINIFEGGPLTILEDSLKFLRGKFSSKYRIIALVHNKELLNIEGIEYIEFRNSRKSWLIRLYYEFFYFYFLSLRIKPYLWFSLHDITPNVRANLRAVYCHNPTPFNPISFNTFFYDYKVGLFTLFYKYLYAINIKKNSLVVVQQGWIRKAFKEMYGLDNIVVAYPEIKQRPNIFLGSHTGKEKLILYPAFPRAFKNMEVIAEAARILLANGIKNFRVIFTFDGVENRYARHLRRKYGDVSAISFIGIKSRDEIYSLYREVDLIIFSSKLETWGLPITEGKSFNLPILLADLPYAHETIGNYDKVKFFNCNDFSELAVQMKLFISGILIFDDTKPPIIEEPFAKNWEELFNLLLRENSLVSR